jgi:hypothetical protein
VVLTGPIDGANGADTLSYAGYTGGITVTLTGAGSSNGTQGTDGGISSGFDNIDTITGGSGADTFDINATTTANLNGGNGGDSFVFGSGVVLTGTVDGQGGSNTLDFTGYSSAVNVDLSATSANGFTGTATGISATFTNISAVDGFTSGTLTGFAGAATWDMSAGTYANGNTLTFTGFDTLTGGSGVDNFNIDANVAYDMNGGGGADVFTFSGNKTTTGAINGGNGTDTIQGDDIVNTWNITAASGGDLNGIAFSNVEDLVGGTAADDFQFNGGSEANVDGGTGSNDIDYSGTGSALTVTLTGAGSSVGYAGGDGTVAVAFDNIGTITGGTGSNTLTGDGIASTWNVGAGSGNGTYNDGSGALTFNGFTHLAGGSAVDTFNLSGGGTLATISGGGSANDVVNIGAGGFGSTGTNLNISTVETINSSAPANVLSALTLTLNGVSSLGSNPANLQLDVGTLKIVNGSGSAFITNAGSITLNAVDMGAGSFSLTATNGDILGAGGTDLTAGAVTLATTGTHNIGTSATVPLDISASSLTASVLNGSIFISNSGGSGLALGAISASSKISITSSSGITVAGSTLSAGNPGITLSTTGSADLTMSGTVQINGGSLTVSTGGQFNLNGTLSMQNANASFTADDLNAGTSAAIGTGAGGNGSVTVTGATTGNTLAITTHNSGKISLGSVNLTSLTLVDDAAGEVQLRGSIVAPTFDASALQGDVVIAGSSVGITSSGGVDLSHARGIDGTTAGGQSLSINAGNSAVKLAPVGQIVSLAKLKVTGGTISVGGVDTSAGQTYTGDLSFGSSLKNNGSGDISVSGNVTLSGAASMTNSGGGAITLGGNVDGKQQLKLAAGSGSVSITGNVGSGAGTALNSLTVSASHITLHGTVTTGQSQAYTGNLILNGNLTSLAGGLSFDGGQVTVNRNLVLTADSMGFNGGTGSVTGTQTLAIVPETSGRGITVGGNGTSTLNLDGAAFKGYAGSLYIGGVPVDFADPSKGVITPVPTGNVDVDSDITLGGTGNTLVVVSTGSLNLNATLQAESIVVGGTVGVFNPNGNGDLVVSDSLVVVGNIIGTEGQDIAAEALSGLPNLVFATHGTQALFKLTEISKQPLVVGDTASTFAGDLNVTINSGATLQNSGQQAAANQQTGGLLGSGFIDVSVFQQISLYDVNGSGITLPSDQCEEESTTGAGCGQ